MVLVDTLKNHKVCIDICTYGNSSCAGCTGDNRNYTISPPGELICLPGFCPQGS